MSPNAFNFLPLLMIPSILQYLLSLAFYILGILAFIKYLRKKDE